MTMDYTDRRFIARRPMTRRQDLAAALKTVSCFTSRFQSLEAHGMVWESVTPGRDNPYYVCARFGNGRHIPGPILAWRAHQRGLQGLLVRLALALRVPAAVAARDAWLEFVRADATDAAVRLAAQARDAEVDRLKAALYRIQRLPVDPDVLADVAPDGVDAAAYRYGLLDGLYWAAGVADEALTAGREGTEVRDDAGRAPLAR
jgi:hypothetical protein